MSTYKCVKLVLSFPKPNKRNIFYILLVSLTPPLLIMLIVGLSVKTDLTYICRRNRYFQVYLVTGGGMINDENEKVFHVSTEIYILGDSSWTLLSESSNLPSFRIGFASVSLDNKIFLTGTFSLSYISDPIQKGLCPK